MTTATEFKSAYQLLLIKQYYEKAKAFAEIGAHAAEGFNIFELVEDWTAATDLDTAIGAQLDLIGATVGLSRSQSGTTLADGDYRFLLRAKVGINNVVAVMVDDSGRSIGDMIRFVFGETARVHDNQDMSLELTVPDTITMERILLLLGAGLLPKPQGVRYFPIAYYIPEGFFGLTEEGEAVPAGMFGFAEDTFAPTAGGAFAEGLSEF